ncbi:MAG: tetratricopeptide repeat protein, partial [Bacteroidota bacterium]|nr:tetratricopeptide repeat protein [Bacteroidota bacterium]
MNKIILLCLAVVLFLPAAAQYRAKKEPNVKDARDNFSRGNYSAALKEYSDLLKADPKNSIYHYKIAICYLNTNTDKTKAVEHLEFVSKQSKFDKQALFELGKAYHHSYRFDEAIEMFKKYKDEMGNKSTAVDEADKYIAFCYNAKELMKFPLDVSFENLGKEINTEFPDYYPFISDDENVLVYTSRRKGNIGGFETIDGFYTSDIYQSKEKAGAWTKARNMGSNINTDGDDEAISVSSDGSYIFIYSENAFEYGDILVSYKKGKSHQRRELLDQNINSNSLEVAGSISPDGNILLFSSDRG